MNPTTPLPRRRRLAVLALGLAVALLAPCSSAQSTDGGSITGRVFNPATSEYVRNAEVRVAGTNILVVTDNTGFYRLANLPGGEVSVVVNYTGYDPATATVNVTPGAVATRDFELTGGATRASDGTVSLGEFVVAAEREGNARAIMDQKAAMNVKNVVATDSFGEIAEGNIGEFLKFMPGIVLDYVETDTRAARMGGLEARYGAVTLDGNAVANAGGSSRQFEFEAMSINNIEAIEVNKTLNADMPADSPAGSVNLRSRSALDRRGQSFNFMAGFIGNQYEHSFRKTPRHDDAEHAKSRPTLSFDYQNIFFDNKLGLTVNGSSSSVFKPQYRQSLSVNYNNSQALARGEPVITAINFKDGVKMTDRYSLGLKLDYQPFGPELRVTLATSYIDFNDKIANRNFAFAVNAAQNDPSSTLTRVVANPVASANTNVNHSGGTGNKQIDTSNAALGFVYKVQRFTLDGQVSYSRARLQNGSDHLGQVDRANLRLSRISWTAERDSVTSTAWNFTQTGGPDWFDLDNYGTADVQAGNIVTGRSTTKTQQFTEQLNLQYNLPTRLPAFIKTGLYHQVMVRAGDRDNQQTLTWVGPTGNQLTSPMPVSIADFRIGSAFGGNIRSLPVPDKTELFRLLTAHPEYFTQTVAQQASDLDNMLANSGQNVEEDITAAYLMGNTRVGRFQLQAGVRYEDTRTLAYSNIRVPDAENPFPANTVERILHRWSRGREINRGNYDDLLPSAAATYRFSDNFLVKLGYHEAIKRAPLDQLAGNWEIDEANQRVSVANPNLEPERSKKYAATLEYYFEPAGSASVHVFQTELDNSTQRTDWMTAEEFGYGNDPIFGDYEFRGWENFPEGRTVKGIEFSYSQRLTFLRSEYLRGTSVFAGYAVQTSNPRPNNFVPRNASAGLSYRYGKFNANLRGTWTPDVLTGGNTVPDNSVLFPGDLEYRKERYIFDLDVSYQLTRRLTAFVSARNAFNSGNVWYYKDSDQRFRQVEKYGGQWTVGIRGRY